MASSKLDYLQKYMSGDKKEKKRRKKDPSKSKNSSVRIVDEDIGFDQITPGAEDVDHAWDLKDDAPVVVEEIDEREQKPVGTWNTIEPATRKSASPSPVRRRGRHDSDDDDDASPARKGRRHDSDDDVSPPRKSRHDSEDDASPPRRGRNASADASPPRKGRRHDSDDDASPPRKARAADTDASPPRKSRAESRGDDVSPPRKGRRHDSDDDASPPRKSRVDSSGDASPPRRDGERKKQKFTSSGHAAGLQSGSAFGAREREIREEQLANAPQVEAQSATVYRDKGGRKVDMLNEFMRQEAIKEGREAQLKEQEFEWGRGAVQKKDEIRKREEFEELKQEPFARMVDDPKLEAMRMEQIRDGDPMAVYMRSKQPATRQKSSKPVYKGPPPPPNRFGIKPGYRWDGIDRGNGWEHRVLTKGNEAMAREEDAYKWRSADL